MYESSISFPKARGSSWFAAFQVLRSVDMSSSLHILSHSNFLSFMKAYLSRVKFPDSRSFWMIPPFFASSTRIIAGVSLLMSATSSLCISFCPVSCLWRFFVLWRSRPRSSSLSSRSFWSHKIFWVTEVFSTGTPNVFVFTYGLWPAFPAPGYCVMYLLWASWI